MSPARRVAETGKLQICRGSAESRPPARASVHTSAMPGMPTTISPYCRRSVRATANWPPSDVYRTKTAVEPTIARIGERPKAAGQHDLRRFDQQGEPDDLRDEHEDGGRQARSRPVVAADDLRQRDRSLAADPPREKESEREKAERPREIEPQSREAVNVDEGRERDRRRAAGRQRGEPDEPPERVEAPVGHEIGRLVTPRPPAPRESDGEYAGKVRDEEERESVTGVRIITDVKFQEFQIPGPATWNLEPGIWNPQSRAAALSATASNSTVPSARARSSMSKSGEWCGRWGPAGAEPTKKKQPGTRERKTDMSSPPSVRVSVSTFSSPRSLAGSLDDELRHGAVVDGRPVDAAVVEARRRRRRLRRCRGRRARSFPAAPVRPLA